MEKTLFPSDYVIVNKIRYGTKIPSQLRDFPIFGKIFRNTNAEFESNSYRILRSFAEFRREDIVVFKAPDNNNKFYVKRIIGMPKDTIQILGSKIILNNKQLKENENYVFGYVKKHDTLFSKPNFLSNKEFDGLSNKNEFKRYLSKDILINYNLFSLDKSLNWTKDNFGPIVIPKKGMRITLTDKNYSYLKKIISNYEGGEVFINKGEIKNYTFKNDYYFVLGDNRHNSIDSRNYGFIPESFIQGKVIHIIR